MTKFAQNLNERIKMKSIGDTAIPMIEKSFYLNDQKKRITFKTPDIHKMQEVIIDNRTKIYIAIGADPDEARTRYKNKRETSGKVQMASRKPVVASGQ
jgi:hypothetical protein